MNLFNLSNQFLSDTKVTAFLAGNIICHLKKCYINYVAVNYLKKASYVI
jgi:hypothetical protein